LTSLYVPRTQDNMNTVFEMEENVVELWINDEERHRWRVERLWKLAENMPVKRVPLSAIKDIDRAMWFSPEQPAPTCRQVAFHAKKIYEADLTYPVILSANGSVFDGMHRIMKYMLEGYGVIQAVQFDTDPEPDAILKNC